MSEESVLIGIDVAKAHIDVAAIGGQLSVVRLGNDTEGHSLLIAALQPLPVTLVVMEATGGYEVPLVCALQAAGLAVVWSIPGRPAILPSPWGDRPRPIGSTRACSPSWRAGWLDGEILLVL